MTTFDKREEGFERRFAHDEELGFKAIARRNHKLGLWAAVHLGKEGEDAETYAMALIALGVAGGGNEALLEKIHADFSAAGVAQSDHQINRHIDEFLAEAQREVLAS